MSTDKTIKDKIYQYLKEQGTYGNTIYFDEKETFEVKPVTKISNDNINNQLIEETISQKYTMPKVINPSDLFTEEPEWKKSKSLDEFYGLIHNCKNCALGNTRKNFVFGSGNPNSDIMIIGEAPGAEEDNQGLPFVGRAGQLLTKIIESINLKREDVYICNILKCRPPENRVPLPDEVEQCEPYLKKQIELIRPQFILALGLTAVDTLFKKKHKMGDIRGSIFNYHGIKLLVTYHPAALLRNPNFKKPVWEDMKNLKKMYDEYLINK